MNKDRSRLKRFGMQKEFDNWVINENKAPKTFNVGDKVRIAGFSQYYKPGEKGVVKVSTNSKYSVLIRFKEPRQGSYEWYVNPDNIEVI